MPSRDIGKKRDTGRDGEVPAELAHREAQDRAKGERGQGSPGRIATLRLGQPLFIIGT